METYSHVPEDQEVVTTCITHRHISILRGTHHCHNKNSVISPVSLVVVFADARPDALLAPPFVVVVLSDARPDVLLASTSLG